MNNNDFLILDALRGPAIILDQNGEITARNSSWKQCRALSGIFGIPLKGDNFFEYCESAITNGNDYALRLLLGIREVFSKSRSSFTLTVSTNHKNNLQWFKVEATLLPNGSQNQVFIVFSDISECMKTIHTLKETETLYRQNFKYSTAGIIVGKSDGTLLDVNPAACNMLGYTKGELINGGRSLIVDEHDPAHREVVRIRNEKSIFQGEKEYRHKDGHFIPVELTSVIFKSADDVDCVINTFRSLKTEKENQYSLEEERRFTKTALNSIPGIFFVINSDKQFVRWNESMLTDLGYSDEEMMHHSVFDIFAPSENQNMHSFIKDAFNNGKTEYIGKIRSKHTGVRHYLLQLNAFKNNDDSFLVVTGVDRTDFIESEKLRQQNYQLMTELFDNSSIATVMINPQNQVQKVNSAFIDLFGYHHNEILGNDVNNLITTKEFRSEAEKISQHAFDGSPDQRTAVRIKKDGTEVPVLISTVPVRNNGQIIAVYGMYVDLSEQVKLENHLQKSLNEKEILLQEVHHRVKNNLAVMAGLLQLQIEKDSNKDAEPKLREAYSRIFSIAKVHEAIYKSVNMAEISFTDYLYSITDSTLSEIQSNTNEIEIQEEKNPLILNVNQAVPLGLLINEIINLIPQSDKTQQTRDINYTCKDENVTISIDGLDNEQIKEFNSTSTDSSFHHLLIRTFQQQLGAEIQIDDKKSTFVITFKKSDSVRGSSNTITDQRDNTLKKNVA